MSIERETLDSTDPHQNLRWAAQRNNTEKVIALLDAGVDASADYYGPLWDAAAAGHTETVKVLLEHGADPFALRAQAVRAAEKNGHTETAEVLREKMRQLNPEWLPRISPLAFKAEGLSKPAP